MNAIRIEGLVKRYGKQRGVDGLDLSVEEGEIFGFIGPNGAGKTTTIRLLLGLIFPTSGRAEVLGRNPSTEPRAIHASVGYVPAEVKYYPRMKVSELIRYTAALHGIRGMGRGPELAERLGLDLERRLDGLSTGNAKKASIVQSLLHSPSLLILDEPTNGLDPLVQSRFYELIREENARGVTVFFSSHVLAEVERLCKRVAMVKDGKIVALESVADLRRKRLRKVSFESAHDPVGPDFPSGNADRFEREGDRTRLYYSGDSGTLIRELAALDLEGLCIEEPSLEEVFMHYYRTEGGQ